MDEQQRGSAPPRIVGYRITRRLGEGGSATVWRARRLADDVAVAIKVLRDPVEDGAVQEYTLLQHAVHDHLVGLHEVTEAETPEGIRTALVLELFAGGSLGEMIAARGHLTAGECVTVLVPLARALSGLHHLGIVHGDLSAGNVLLDSTGRPVLADLGLGRLVAQADDLDEQGWGTEGFVAPEVVVGGSPTTAADVYAAGALGWLALTGEAPGHVACRRRLAVAAPGTPEPLIALIESCLDPEPERRPDAESLAVEAFDAALAEPLRLTVAGDVGTALTRRLRGPSSDDEERPKVWQIDPEAAGRTPRWRRARLPRRPSRPRSLGKHRPVAPRLGGVTMAAAGVAAGLAVIIPWPFASRAPDAPIAAATAAAPSTGPHGVLAQVDGPREQPVRTMKALLDARSRVLATGDPRRLVEVDAPGSSALAADRKMLATLRRADVRYVGVRWRVVSASHQSSDGDAAVIRARVDAEPFREVSGTGATRERPARRGVAADYHLVRVEGHWRVSRVVSAR